MTVREYGEALRRDYDKFSWPPDRQPDLAVLFHQTQPPPNPHGRSAVLQDGYQDLILAIINQCAWYLAWSDAHSDGDGVAERAALKVMTDIIPNFPTLDPDARQFAIAVAQKAALGDGSVAMEVVQGNCADTKWQSE